MHWIFSLLFLLLTLLSSGCGTDLQEAPSSVQEETSPQAEPPPVPSSEKTPPLSSITDSDGRILLRLSLQAPQEKHPPLLWTVHWMPGRTFPAAESQRTRRMKFSVQDARVVFEELDDASQSLGLVSTFPILARGPGWVDFDFNEGLAHFYQQPNRLNRDHGSEHEGVSQEVKRFSLEGRYIRRAYLDPSPQKSTLIIEQKVRIRNLGSGELRHFFVPERADGEELPFRDVGVIARQRRGVFEPLGFANRMVRWNLERLTPVGLSSSIPKPYRAAIREGIKYWNSILSPYSHSIEVIDLDQESRGPQPGRARIEWVDRPDLEEPYTNLTVHPISGEILEAQIYLPGHFAVQTVKQANRVFFRYKGMFPLLDASAGLAGGLKPKANANETSTFPDSEGLQRIVSDYFVMVVAHEMGHLLGLRHNFAGSTASTLTAKERDDLFQDYLSLPDLSSKKDEAQRIESPKESPEESQKDTLFTATVMDYLLIQDHLMAARQIREGKVFPYDQDTLRWLYFSESQNPSSLQTYCTDWDVQAYVDCRMHDSGSSPVLHLNWVLKSSLNNLAATLIEKFTEVHHQEGHLSQRNHEDLLPSVNRFVQAWGDRFSDLLSILSDESRSIQVHFKGLQQKGLLERGYWLASGHQQAWIKGQGELLSKNEGAFWLFPPKRTKKFSLQAAESLLQIFADPNRRLDFTNNEKDFVLQTSAGFLQHLEETLYLEALNRMKELDPNAVRQSDDFGKDFAEILALLVTSQDQGEFMMDREVQRNAAVLLRTHLSGQLRETTLKGVQQALSQMVAESSRQASAAERAELKKRVDDLLAVLRGSN